MGTTLIATCVSEDLDKLQALVFFVRVASLTSSEQPRTRSIFVARSGRHEECKRLNFWLEVSGGRWCACTVYGV